jgi:hypothetical protein
VITKSTSRHNHSSLIPTDVSKDLHPFFIAPSFSAKELRARNGSDIRSPRVLPDPSPREAKDISRLIHSKLNISSKQNFKKAGQKKESKKNVDPSSQSLSFDYLKLKTKEKLRNNLVKQSMYHELLKEKFGFIKPRLK